MIKSDPPKTRQFRDLSGKSFGRLTVTEFAGHKEFSCGKRRYFWHVTCSCGNKDVKAHAELMRGETLSCGCLMRQAVRARSIKHHSCNSPEYMSWRSMLQKCSNRNYHKYGEYGGKGISICLNWMMSFEAFRSDMGPRPDGCVLERIDQNGNYEPGNCQWVKVSEKAKRRKPLERRKDGTFIKRRKRAA